MESMTSLGGAFSAKRGMSRFSFFFIAQISFLLAMPVGAQAATFTNFEVGYALNATVNGQTSKNVPYGAHVYGSAWTVVDE